MREEKSEKSERKEQNTPCKMEGKCCIIQINSKPAGLLCPFLGKGGATVKQLRKNRTGLSSFLLRIGAVALIAYLAVTLIVCQVDIMVKRQRLETLNAELSRQTEENTELERLYSSGDNDAYIERIARDRLGYVSPDERIYIDMSGE